MKAETLLKQSFTTRVVDYFLRGHMSVLFIVISVLVGAVALTVTPREEEPQITVPMADVLISMPGATPAEVEALAGSKLEKLLMEIDGVENVYLSAQPGGAMVTVQFYVGEDRERSLVKLSNKLQSNLDKVPPSIAGWVVKPIEIDDVPIVTLTLFHDGARYGDYELRRVAEELEYHLQQIKDVGKTFIVSGRPRQISVELSKDRLSSFGLTPGDVAHALEAANIMLPAGELLGENRRTVLEAGEFIRSVEDVGRLVVSVVNGRPIMVRDVATVSDGPGEVRSYTWLGFGAAANLPHAIEGSVPEDRPLAQRSPAVTLAISKKRGANAVAVGEEVVARMEELRQRVIPGGMHFLVSRNYGETANEKVNELVLHLLIAVLTILVLLIMSLGLREALIVALAVPMTLAFTLIADTALGFTINRVTLFALILSLGLLVDDPIVDVENISRHFKLRKLPPRLATLFAVDEIRPPTILATLAVVVSFLPLFMVSGMMGPYMAPMPLNISVAMIMSLVVAFTVTPWATFHLLKHEYNEPHHDSAEHDKPGFILGGYRRLMRWLLTPARSWALLIVVGLLFIGSVILPALNLVPLKMLPFGNKDELQVVIDMPRGTTVETTDQVAAELGEYLARQNEVVSYQTYAGTASPFDFNGLVRHYYMRTEAHRGDVRLQLAPRKSRIQGTHEFALRIRNGVQEIARKHNANVKIVESPPGPPVLATAVAEVTGESWVSEAQLNAAAKQIRAVFEKTPGFVDVDDFVDADQTRLRFVPDQEKAMLHGITIAGMAQMTSMASGGAIGGFVRTDRERNPLPVVLQLPLAERSTPELIMEMDVRARNGSLIELGELVRPERELEGRAIYHKNGKRSQFVTAEVAGTSPYRPILSAQSSVAALGLAHGIEVNWLGEGEWKITVDVFRDMGIAFAVALVGIFLLLLIQTGSIVMPLIIMAAIPLTLIGIMPGFAALNLLFSGSVGGYDSPIFFTATGMIGMIALAGIVVRNSIILVDFIQTHVRSGMPIETAIIEAGYVRFRPIVLTAAAAVMGSWVIVLDPIFSGLAWSFIFGIFASTGFTLVVIPLIFYLVFRNAPPVQPGGPSDPEEDFLVEEHGAGA